MDPISPAQKEATVASETDSAHKFLDSFAESWSSNDGSTLGELFTEDGSLVNPFGERADGQEAIAAMYSGYFAGMLAGTSTTIEVETIRPVGDSHALVDAEQAITTPDGGVVLVVHLTALLRRDGEEWRFVDSRPYTPASAPA
jgi:uncharacterized protein (TIGR02246 family)